MFDRKHNCVVVVGAQWGDEGKGKLVDVLAERANWVVRYQGGANAGHTVHIGETSFVLHQIPSGILHPGVRCAIGNGVVLDPETLFTEIDELIADGVDVEGRRPEQRRHGDATHDVGRGDLVHLRAGRVDVVQRHLGDARPPPGHLGADLSGPSGHAGRAVHRRRPH